MANKANHKEIIKAFKNKNPQTVYLLHGDESYYIDAITDAATEYILEEHERDFNQTILYGKDLDVGQLQEQVKRFPMMAERQLVIVKEAQNIKNWDIMIPYFENPTPTTVLIIAHKHKKVDSRKKFVKAITNNGVVFESKKLYENQVDKWIVEYVSSEGYSIDHKATMLLVEFLGADLGRIVKELEKLMIIVDSSTTINAEHIERNIGISKDYNVFELTSAFCSRDTLKVNTIINYFEQNPKATNIIPVISNLFYLHENLLKAQYLKIRDMRMMMSQLKMSYPQAKDIEIAVKYYPLKKVAGNIAHLQEYDLKSKGINRGPGSDADLLRELLFLLMH
ncbi:MAG: DNA polymerase III subunit delta [Brumimicrobium sp.]